MHTLTERVHGGEATYSLPGQFHSLPSMKAWVEGIKDVMEPLIILLLAWALGAVIAVRTFTPQPLTTCH